MKQWLRPGCQPSPLAVGLKDLLDADSRGRWWIVGSAWSGKGDNGSNATRTTAPGAAGDGHDGSGGAPSHSAELLEKARQMRMNTDSRRAVFCAIMSAGDYLDAFERCGFFSRKL